mmetsp:Transcript_93129/g.267129  ORF Transcript_93129/g.267129 Transcript_93129/m.267129 type:complete len:226 (+) Transcript_93129:207-884(+)
MSQRWTGFCSTSGVWSGWALRNCQAAISWRSTSPCLPGSFRATICFWPRTWPGRRHLRRRRRSLAAKRWTRRPSQRKRRRLLQRRRRRMRRKRQPRRQKMRKRQLSLQQRQNQNSEPKLSPRLRGWTCSGMSRVSASVLTSGDKKRQGELLKSYSGSMVAAGSSGRTTRCPPSCGASLRQATPSPRWATGRAGPPSSQPAFTTAKPCSDGSGLLMVTGSTQSRLR